MEIALTEGIYPLEGNKFNAGGSRFFIKERKQETEKKPKHFLIALSPFQYISSLFPVGKEGTFNFDYKQELFELEMIEGSRVSIKKLEPIQEVL